MLLKGKANVYEEIVLELKKLIEVGALKEGDKLPSVRFYAMERKVNPNTVAKAYAALEEEGIIKIFPKKGAYVGGIQKREEKIETLKKQVLIMKELGITKQQWLAVIEEIYDGEETR